MSDLTKFFALLLFNLILWVSGFALLVIYGNWQLAVGVFLLMWASNIDNKLRNEN